MAKADADLVAALVQASRSAWAFWRKNHPAERFYAFALYTTPDASYYVPAICGEDGLTKVAQGYLDKYAGKPGYGTLEESRAGLRWSFADSPYQRDGERFFKAIEGVLGKRPSPYGSSERAADREIAIRHASAVAALRTLDEEGLFGTGAERARIVLLIVAGDWEGEFVLAFARRLNPKAVYEAFARPFRCEVKGKFRELGSKKVYDTRRLALSADGRVLTAVAQHEVFCFDVPPDGTTPAQLWCKRVRRGDYLVVDSVAATADGSVIAGTYESGGIVEYGVALWRGKGWKEAAMYPLPRGAGPLDVAIAPDGAWVAVSSQDNRVRVLRASDGVELATLDGHTEWPRGLASSADGRWLASADVGAGVHLWDTTTWALAKTLDRPADGLAFTADGRWLISAVRWPKGWLDESHQALEGQVALVWDLAEGRVAHEVRVPGWRIQRAVPSPDGRLMACGCEMIGDATRHAAFMVETATGRVTDELSADFEGINDFAFLSDSVVAVAVYGHHYKPVLLWEVGGRTR